MDVVSTLVDLEPGLPTAAAPPARRDVELAPVRVGDPVHAPSVLCRLAQLFAAPLLFAVVVQNIANFAFHAVVGRVLPADAYGALGSVLAIMVLLSVPLTALQASASASVSSGWNSATVRRTLVRVALASAVVGSLVLLVAHPIQSYFRLASAADAAMLAPFVAVSIVLAIGRGLLLGDRRVRATALTYLTGTAARFGLGVALVLPFGVTGALLGTLLGETVALVTALVPALRRRGRSPQERGLELSQVGLSGLAVTGLFLFSTVDLLLSRHYLNGDASGVYTAAATIGKTVLALPAAVIGVYFPKLITAWRAGDLRVLRQAVSVVCGLALLGALVVAVAPGLLLHLLYGSGFATAAPLVRMLAIIAGLTSVVSVLTYAGLARRGFSIIVPWLGALLEIALIARRHATAMDVAHASLMALIPTLVVMAAWEGTAWWNAGHVRPIGRHERLA